MNKTNEQIQNELQDQIDLLKEEQRQLKLYNQMFLADKLEFNHKMASLEKSLNSKLDNYITQMNMDVREVKQIIDVFRNELDQIKENFGSFRTEYKDKFREEVIKHTKIRKRLWKLRKECMCKSKTGKKK